MNKNKPSQILDWAVEDKIPARLDVKERVMQVASQSGRLAASPRMKLAGALAIALGALLLLSTAAYAVVHFIIDPGLQAVQDAGLVSDVGASAQPTIMPTDASPAVQAAALTLNQSQTVEGATMTLDWVYLDPSRLMFGLRYSNLPADVSVGFPTVTVNGEPLGAGRQEGRLLQSDASQAIYVSYQVLNPAIVGDSVSLQMDVPVVRSENGGDTQAAVFHFDAAGVPLVQNQSVTFEQTRAITLNGVKLTLDSIRLTPAGSDVVICPPADGSTPLILQSAALAGPELPEAAGTIAAADEPAGCSNIHFDAAVPVDAASLMLKVNNDWQFSIDLPREDLIPGLKTAEKPTEASIGSQSIDKVTVTLDWVFADANRLAFGYTVTGISNLPEIGRLAGTVAVTDAQGNPLDGGYGGSTEIVRSGNVLKGTWSAEFRQPLTAQEFTANIAITLDGTHGSDWNYILGFFGQPPTSSMGMPQTVPAGLVGTYNFNVTTRVYPMTTLEPRQAVSANSIDMELVTAELTPSSSAFVVCFDKPDAREWNIMDSTLTVGLQQARLEGVVTLSDPDFSLKNPGAVPQTSVTGDHVRCLKLDFPLGNANQALTYTLTIGGIEIIPPEVIPQAEMDAAIAKLAEQGIEMTYLVVQNGGGGGSGPQFTKKPDGMSDQEAYNRYIAALGYRMPGPWTFTFPYQP